MATPNTTATLEDIDKIAGLQSDAAIIDGKLSDNIYYISNNGSDTNSGLSPSKPFQTIAKALTLTTDETTLRFECGSIFYEPLVYSSNKLKFESYGDGNLPIIDGSSIIDTPTLVSGNVWQTTNTFTSIGGIGRPMLLENGIPMQPVANQTECEDLPNSYVVESGDSFSNGDKTIMFHTSDSSNPTSNGNEYRVNNKDAIAPSSDQTGLNPMAKNIEARYGFTMTTMGIHNGLGSVVDGCVCRYGNKHNIFISADGIAKNCVAYGSELQGEYGRTATLYVAYTSDGTNRTATFENCVAILDLKKGGVKQGFGQIGFLSHSPDGDFEKETLTNCYGRGIGIPFGIQANIVEVNNCYFEKLGSKCIENVANNTIIKNSFFQAEFDNNTTNEYGTVNYKNTTFINHRYADCSTSDINYDNCLFYGGTKQKSSAYMLSTNTTNGAKSLKMNNTIVFGYQVFLIGIVGTDYVGDYNIFYNTSGISFRGYYNGVQYNNNFEQWQTDTNQDTNSVYLTDAQAEKFFLTDPNTGIVTINPYAEVTGGDGTVYKGTFPDGTLLLDKIKNKNYSNLKSQYVDKLDLLQYQN